MRKCLEGRGRAAAPGPAPAEGQLCNCREGRMASSRNPIPLLVLSLAHKMTDTLGKRVWGTAWEMKRTRKEITGSKSMETVP